MLGSKLLATGQSLQYWLRCFLCYIIAHYGKTNALLNSNLLQALLFTIITHTIITYQNLMTNVISKYCFRLF